MYNKTNSRTTVKGVNFCGLLLIVFIVLKLCGVITWSWLWVLAPLWIPTAFFLLIIIIVTAVSTIKERRAKR